MDQEPLVKELIEAGARFLGEFGIRYPVAVAFWLKTPDESRWHLHIASEKIGNGPVGDAYGEVVRVTRDMKDIDFDPSYVRLRKMDDRIIQFALDYQRRHPAHFPAVYDVPSFHGVEVEAMYLYPPLQAAAA